MSTYNLMVHSFLVAELHGVNFVCNGCKLDLSVRSSSLRFLALAQHFSTQRRAQIPLPDVALWSNHYALPYVRGGAQIVLLHVPHFFLVTSVISLLHGVNPSYPRANGVRLINTRTRLFVDLWINGFTGFLEAFAYVTVFYLSGKQVSDFPLAWNELLAVQSFIPPGSSSQSPEKKRVIPTCYYYAGTLFQRILSLCWEYNHFLGFLSAPFFLTGKDKRTATLEARNVTPRSHWFDSSYRHDIHQVVVLNLDSEFGIWSTLAHAALFWVRRPRYNFTSLMDCLDEPWSDVAPPTRPTASIIHPRLAHAMPGGIAPSDPAKINLADGTRQRLSLKSANDEEIAPMMIWRELYLEWWRFESTAPEPSSSNVVQEIKRKLGIESSYKHSPSEFGFDASSVASEDHTSIWISLRGRISAFHDKLMVAVLFELAVLSPLVKFSPILWL
ncbi:hypothetical protein BDZ89DRAFT_1124073 [Hymenopellis radicata]|nr:hypothetical protein BDZ89DRAFT_1124073 [Hymenopellis radicata]